MALACLSLAWACLVVALVLIVPEAAAAEVLDLVELEEFDELELELPHALSTSTAAIASRATRPLWPPEDMAARIARKAAARGVPGVV